MASEDVDDAYQCRQQKEKRKKEWPPPGQMVADACTGKMRVFRARGKEASLSRSPLAVSVSVWKDSSQQ